MTEQEIVEGNTLIGKEMNGPDYGWDFSNTQTPSYHNSWNHLMPVIEKISRIKFGEDTDSPDTYYPRTFGMLNPETGKPMFRFNLHVCFEADTLIDAAWLAVVDFLKPVNP